MVDYTRVSTDHQSLEAQRNALTGVGCERIFTDTLSGARDDRRSLTGLLGDVLAGDTVVVTALTGSVGPCRRSSARWRP